MTITGWDQVLSSAGRCLWRNRRGCIFSILQIPFHQHVQPLLHSHGTSADVDRTGRKPVRSVLTGPGPAGGPSSFRHRSAIVPSSFRHRSSICLKFPAIRRSCCSAVFICSGGPSVFPAAGSGDLRELPLPSIVLSCLTGKFRVFVPIDPQWFIKPRTAVMGF